MDMGSGLGDKMGESSQVHATFVHGGGVEPRGETTRRGRRHELGASYPRTSQASTQNRSHGGDRSSWEDGVWNMQKEQWKLVWDGERAFWNVVPKLIAAGYARVEDMAQGTCEGSTKVRKIPLLTRVNAEEGTQTVRILLTRELAGVQERTRHTMQRWLDMVDWRAARVGSKPDQKKQGIEWYLERGTGQVRSNHPARTWVEGQEKQARAGRKLREHSTSRNVLRFWNR